MINLAACGASGQPHRPLCPLPLEPWAPLIPRKIPCGIESFSFLWLPLIAEHIWVAAAFLFFLGVLRVIYSI